MNALTSFGYGMQGANAAIRDNAATDIQQLQARSMQNLYDLQQARNQIMRWAAEVVKQKKQQDQQSAQPAGMEQSVPEGALPGRPGFERMSGVQAYACGGHVKKYADGGQVAGRRFNGIPDATAFDYQQAPSTLSGLQEAYDQFHRAGFADGGQVGGGDVFSRVLAFANGGQVPAVSININNCAGGMGKGSEDDTEEDGEGPEMEGPEMEGPEMEGPEMEADDMGEMEGGEGAIPGRLVQGPGTGTSDSIPAVIDGQQPAALSNGEYVIPADIVQKYGVQFFDQLTEQGRRHGN